MTDARHEEPGAEDALPADEPIVYRARAARWEDGWELHVEGVGITRLASVEAAESQVRDYIETAMDLDTTGAEIAIEWDEPLRDLTGDSSNDERPDQ